MVPNEPENIFLYKSFTNESDLEGIKLSLVLSILKSIFL